MIENLSPAPEMTSRLHGDAVEVMNQQAENHSREFIVQTNNELCDNPIGVKDFAIFVGGSPVSSGFTALDSAVARHEQYHTHTTPHSGTSNLLVSSNHLLLLFAML